MVETVSRIVDDEFCCNESYSDKPTTTTSIGAAAAAAPAPPPPPTSRGPLGEFDYYSLTYDDPSDYDDSD